MPTYGSAKHRTMARSVLPANARARKAARQAKRRVHGAVRAAERGLLSTAAWDDAFDERVPRALDAQHGAHDGVRSVVSRRREADKVGPLLRWALASADELGADPAERVAKLRTLLPDGLIGEHAISHLEWEEAFDASPYRWWRVTRDEREAIEAERARAAASLRDLMRHQLAVRADGFGELNALLKGHWPSQDGRPLRGRRLIAGLHDVDDFVAEVTRTAGVDRWQPCEAHRERGCGCFALRRQRMELVAAWCELA
ncbi:MAG: hypothetical protein U0P45_13560 [Acidimicrobiales bacterium]